MKYLDPTLIIFLCLISSTCFTQDNHYESVQLGSRNAILSGASVSRWVDQTAVVNNPATMIFGKGAGVSLSTAAGVFENIRFVNGLGEGVTVKSSSFVFYPGFVAGEIPFLKREGKRTMGFAIYNHVTDKIRFTNRVAYTANIINDVESPGDEAYVGIFSLDSDLNETAFALGWGERLSDQWAVGLTWQGFYRHHRFRRSYSTTAIADPANNPMVDVVGGDSEIDISYSAFIVRLKGGLAWRNEGWQAGLTFTVPTIKMWASGDLIADVRYDNFLVGSERRSFYANTYVEKAKTTFKYPINIGLGVSRQFDKVHASLSALYYTGLKRYRIIDPGEIAFLQPPSNENILYTQDFLSVWSENNPVFNVAASTVWSVGKDKSLLLGFRTDGHYQEFNDPEDTGLIISHKLWNRYHFSAGMEFNINRSHWIVGMQYSHGNRKDYLQPVSFANVSEENDLFGTQETGEVNQGAIQFSISYSFQLAPNTDNTQGN